MVYKTLPSILSLTWAANDRYAGNKTMLQQIDHHQYLNKAASNC